MWSCCSSGQELTHGGHGSAEAGPGAREAPPTGVRTSHFGTTNEKSSSSFFVFSCATVHTSLCTYCTHELV